MQLDEEDFDRFSASRSYLAAEFLRRILPDFATFSLKGFGLIHPAI